MTGIIAFGGYIPLPRLDRTSAFAATGWFNSGLKGLAKGERAFAGWDEDTITMAVEAARDCLGGRDRRAVARLALASTTLPNADRQNATIVKEALNLPDDIATFDMSGSQRAGTSALLDAFYAAAGGAGDTLVIASERGRFRPGSESELLGGHGAAAMLVGDSADAVRFIGGHSLSIDFVDHFRAEGQSFDYQWEARWVREEGYLKIVPAAIKATLEKLQFGPGDIQHFLFAAPMRGVDQAIAKAAGIAPEAVVDNLAGTLGHAGTAQPLLLLSHLLERAGAKERVMLCGFGGGCDVIVLEIGDDIAAARPGSGVAGALAVRRSEDNYTRYLALSGLLDLEKGMRAELDQKPALTALYRERKSVLGLVGGRCTDTGEVQFPKTPVSVNAARTVRTQEDYPLAELPARIVAYTADYLAYTPEPPAYYGTVVFEGGGRLMTEFVDVGEEGVEIGQPVRMVFRIKAVDNQRHFTKYFWKASPHLRNGGPGISQQEN